MLLARRWSRKPFLATWHHCLPVTRCYVHLHLCSLSIIFYMVGALGHDPRTYRLKADCSSQLELYSHIGPSAEIRTQFSRLKRPDFTIKVSLGWCIKSCLTCHKGPIRGFLMTLQFSMCHCFFLC